ncbi:hypothetical protein OG909_11885 [Streptomyces sp. NBC_01754]|uniref:hypothetical protein n=1 Tax=Streptomyces sp. NBC_01754 TaxID=2975930 RepID=UPI002DDAFC36|nr:hypothetical protein [Streptomyces sp. NBC_01754]WSC92937.1 hypothetical protein OG909_11885 [Streptomyces sp. NBC_01754]
MSAATTHTAALFAQAPARPHGALVARAGDTGPLSVPVGGIWDVTCEEAAAALFEVYSDEHAVPGITTDTLYALLGTAVSELGPVGLVETTDVFSGLDSVEFPEVGACRWYAYRLALSFWYKGARSRPMAAGEAAAALALSGYTLTSGAGRLDPGTLARQVREGAARVPTAALLQLGRAVSADLARIPDPGGSGTWLYRRLLPDWQRARHCLGLIRGSVSVPLPLVVRTDDDTYRIGATPPPGPGIRWARPLRAQW